MSAKLTAKQHEFLSALVKADLVSDWQFGAATKTWALNRQYATRRTEVRKGYNSLPSAVTIYSITDAGRSALNAGGK